MRVSQNYSPKDLLPEQNNILSNINMEIQQQRLDRLSYERSNKKAELAGSYMDYGIAMQKKVAALQKENTSLKYFIAANGIKICCTLMQMPKSKFTAEIEKSVTNNEEDLSCKSILEQQSKETLKLACPFYSSK
jgi:hypothetical protein